MPPSHRNKPLKGRRNIVAFPNQCIRALSAKAINSVKGKSQFEVCGAPTRTNLGISGSWPSARHPARLNISRQVRCKNGSSPGVLNIVRFTFFKVLLFKNFWSTDFHRYTQIQTPMNPSPSARRKQANFFCKLCCTAPSAVRRTLNNVSVKICEDPCPIFGF